MAHTNPPQGDPTLHAFARLLADAVGADAAGVWMGGHTGQPPARWGGHGFPHAAAALQAHFETAHIAAFGKATAGLLAETRVEVVHPEKVEIV